MYSLLLGYSDRFEGGGGGGLPKLPRAKPIVLKNPCLNPKGAVHTAIPAIVPAGPRLLRGSKGSKDDP